MPITKEQILAHADKLSKLSSDLSLVKEQIIKEAAVDFNKVNIPNYSQIDTGIGSIPDSPVKGTGMSADELFRQFVFS